MMNRNWLVWRIILGGLLLATPLVARAEDGLGQSIQIYTNFHSFVGRPSWLLIIRDIDNNQNIPYIYDFEHGTNFWVAFTFGRNYLITTSTLHFSPYRHNPYDTKKISNFCNLESNGSITRGQSMYITMKGDLTPNTRSFTCNVTRSPNANFYVVQPGAK